MVICETEAQLRQCFGQLGKDSFLFPIFADAKLHPKVNPLSLLYIHAGNESFILPLSHNEVASAIEPAQVFWALDGNITPGRSFTPFTVPLRHALKGICEVVIDLASVAHAKGQELKLEEFYPNAMRAMLTKYQNRPNIFQSIPLMVIADYCDRVYEGCKKWMDTWFEELAVLQFRETLDACYFMEDGGIRVNPTTIQQHFGDYAANHVHDGYVYAQYNPYTTTNRVTNHFGGINFSALNKENGCREAFISRFTNGAMVLIDFESFHLRLITEMIQFELPEGPVHEYFGRQYFQTDSLTPEQYEESKKITFQMLYGDHHKPTHIPFFQQVYRFIDTLWMEMLKKGYITSSASHHRIYLDRMDQPSPAKVFNYLLQLRESEVAMTAISEVGRLFHLFRATSKVVLYTYDSILLDFNYDDGKELLCDVVDVLERQGRFPVRVYAGANYNDLKNVTNIMKTTCVAMS